MLFRSLEIFTSFPRNNVSLPRSIIFVPSMYLILLKLYFAPLKQRGVNEDHNNINSTYAYTNFARPNCRPLPSPTNEIKNHSAILWSEIRCRVHVFIKATCNYVQNRRCPPLTLAETYFYDHKIYLNRSFKFHTSGGSVLLALRTRLTGLLFLQIDQPYTQRTYMYLGCPNRNAVIYAYLEHKPPPVHLTLDKSAPSVHISNESKHNITDCKLDSVVYAGVSVYFFRLSEKDETILHRF